MGFFGKLFGSEDVVKKTVDGIYDGIDALVFTDEEKARHTLDKAEVHLKFLKAYEPFKLAQRLLALLVGIPYVFIWVWCAALMSIGAFVDNPSTYLELSKTLGEYNNDTLGVPFSIILSFYFAGGMVEGGIRTWNEVKK